VCFVISVGKKNYNPSQIQITYILYYFCVIIIVILKGIDMGLSLKAAVKFINKHDLNNYYIACSANKRIVFKEKTFFSRCRLGRWFSTFHLPQLAKASTKLLKYIAEKHPEKGDGVADTLKIKCKAKLTNHPGLYKKIKEAYKKTQSVNVAAPAQPMKPFKSDYERLIDFYVNGKANDHGVTLKAIQEYTASALEKNHKYIDWLFPTSRGGTDKTAPLITEQNYPYLAAHEQFRNALLLSFKGVMLPFYGLDYDEECARVSEGVNYAQRAPNLIRPDNHNFLRLTRIIECLRLFEFQAEADALYDWLIEELYLNAVNRRRIAQSKNYPLPFTYWAKAAGRELPEFD
jgi:hypothetical protein